LEVKKLKVKKGLEELVEDPQKIEEQQGSLLLLCTYKAKIEDMAAQNVLISMHLFDYE
jgi:hypothetical protein